MCAWPRGKPLSEQAKKKLSLVHRGRRLPATVRAHQSEARQVSLVLATDAAMRSPRRGGRRG
jgi:hypothetical protein